MMDLIKGIIKAKKEGDKKTEQELKKTLNSCGMDDYTVEVAIRRLKKTIIFKSICSTVEELKEAFDKAESELGFKIEEVVGDQDFLMKFFNYNKKQFGETQTMFGKKFEKSNLNSNKSFIVLVFDTGEKGIIKLLEGDKNA